MINFVGYLHPLKQVVCRQCESILEFTKDELNIQYTDTNGSRFGHIMCPCCGACIKVYEDEKKEDTQHEK